MGIRRMRGAMRCARAYGSAQSQPRRGGTQDTGHIMSGTGLVFQKRKGEEVCGRNLAQVPRHQTESTFFPEWMDAISASGIHQKDPHVSGVTKSSWAENEARARQSVVKKKQAVCTVHDGGGGGRGRCITLLLSISGKRKPLDRGQAKRLGLHQQRPPRPKPPPPPLEHCIRTRRGDRT
jgi:hypothetical protein